MQSSIKNTTKYDLGGKQNNTPNRQQIQTEIKIRNILRGIQHLHYTYYALHLGY